MKKLSLLSLLFAITVAAEKRPSVQEFLMPSADEVALARSAAPQSVSSRATVKILTTSGYKVAAQGDNGFVCMVMRGWTAPTYTPAEFRDLVYDPTVRAPICFDPIASKNVLPYYELRTTLGMQGKSPDQIAAAIEAAYVRGEIPKRDAVSFAYMWSAHQHLAPGIESWRPHMMIFAPYYDNALVGGHPFGSPFPQVSDDAGTPFTVVVIPVDPSLAGKTHPHP